MRLQAVPLHPSFSFTPTLPLNPLQGVFSAVDPGQREAVAAAMAAAAGAQLTPEQQRRLRQLERQRQQRALDAAKLRDCRGLPVPNALGGWRGDGGCGGVLGGMRAAHRVPCRRSPWVGCALRFAH